MKMCAKFNSRAEEPIGNHSQLRNLLRLALVFAIGTLAVPAYGQADFDFGVLTAGLVERDVVQDGGELQIEDSPGLTTVVRIRNRYSAQGLRQGGM